MPKLTIDKKNFINVMFVMKGLRSYLQL